MKKPVVLVICDGLGLLDKIEGNAFKQANTPVFDELFKDYPNVSLKASGEAVGLPAGQMGNSEVGHLNIGAGEIVYTGLSLIKKALDDGLFSKNEAFLKSIAHAKKHDKTIQVMGLLSPGGVHSLEEHLYGILDLLYKEGIKKVNVHAFTDGRDVSPRSVKSSLEKLLPLLEKYNFSLASISGRLYSMDRDAMFNKTEKAYETIRGVAENHFDNIIDYIDSQYAKDLTDEFIEPAVGRTNGNFLEDGDSVIFFNFRPDRARQLAHLIVGSSLYKETPTHPVKDVQLTSMMKYEKIDKADIAFDSMSVPTPIGKVLSDAGLKQLRIAETQKYAHVTFFMDGGVDIEYPGADRILVPSLKIDNFAEAPEMSAKGITDKLIEALPKYDVVIMNYANPDMVGHTGELKPAIRAVEFLDTQIGRLKDATDKLGGTLFITADHGNCEIMLDASGKPATSHTSSLVPLIVTDKQVTLSKGGSLANVAPTILDYIGVEKSNSMDHDSLLKK